MTINIGHHEIYSITRTVKIPRDAKERATNTCLAWNETFPSKCDPGNNCVEGVFLKTSSVTLVNPTTTDIVFCATAALARESDDMLREVKLTVIKISIVGQD